LTVRLLNRSIPPQVLNEFRKQLQQSANAATLEFAPESQLQTLLTLLQTWKRTAGKEPSFALPGTGAPPIADLVTLGDSWLTTAIQQNLIQPLELSQLKSWSQLPQAQRWQTLVTRNAAGQIDRTGKIWGAPYRWGTTVIAYRQDLFQERKLQPPTDWADLWRPDLQRRISLLDQPREVIGLTLKKLGHSYNTQDLTTIPTLDAELKALQAQVKFYSSTSYLQPLLLGDTWVAVGWSTDVLPLMQRSQQIAAVVPRSGTALWADLWVRPANLPAISELVKQWIEFCWQPQPAKQLTQISWAASPSLFAAEPPPDLRQAAIVLPEPAILTQSEFLLPLAEAALAQYRSAWERLRHTV
jgi:putative spermidine/putrescine transport system substrate-binding protein